MLVHKLRDSYKSNKRTIITIGNYDGVHKGHIYILEKLTHLAKDNNLDSVLITFNPHTKIKYSLPESSQISLIVFNSLGQIVKILDNGFKQKGSHSLTFDGSELPSGTYFYQLSSKDFIKTEKMSLLK